MVSAALLDPPYTIEAARIVLREARPMLRYSLSKVGCPREAMRMFIRRNPSSGMAPVVDPRTGVIVAYLPPRSTFLIGLGETEES